LTTRKSLLLERGTLPLSPRLEGADPRASKHLLGSKAYILLPWHNTKMNHHCQLHAYLSSLSFFFALLVFSKCCDFICIGRQTPSARQCKLISTSRIKMALTSSF
jgi:hypothetical protein